jgi:hypothetical protein
VTTLPSFFHGLEELTGYILIMQLYDSFAGEGCISLHSRPELTKEYTDIPQKFHHIKQNRTNLNETRGKREYC